MTQERGHRARTRVRSRKEALAGRANALVAPALALLVLVLVLGAAACGEAHKSAAARLPASGAAAVSAASSVAPAPPGRLEDDQDLDGPAATSSAHNGHGADEDDDSYSNAYYDFDDGNVLDYGRAASAADAQAAAAAVRRYYATAARDDGAAVCRQVSPSLARAVIEEYGHSSSLRALRGRTCKTVMTALLRELHGNMSHDSAALRTGVVRVNGTTAQVLLSFDGSWPNSYTVLHRERGAWRVAELLPQGLP